MSKTPSKAQLVLRPAVTVAGLSVLGVIILSALHEVSAPRVSAGETGKVQTETLTKATAAKAAEVTAETKPADEKSATETAPESSEQPSDTEVKVAEKQAAPKTGSTADSTGEFSDIVMGDPNAPVTVIEYASMTCPHCASFHANTLPDLKEQYIDTGKVKFILRAFPLDNLAAAAFMLAHCVDEESYYPFIDMLFEKQSQWSRADDPVQELRQITKIAGFTEEKFNRCITDQNTLDYIQRVRDEGNQKYDIRSTPTLIINGQKLEGAQPIDKLKAVIDPLLQETEKS